MIPVETAPEVYRLNFAFVNAYLIGNARGWVLVDSGIAGQFEAIRDAADQQFGIGAKPAAIILTHGHGDHSGSALQLATYWDVPIYAHRMELPFLNGKSDYPPADPTVGGPFALAMRFAPNMMHGSDFGDVVQVLPEDGSIPGLEDEWRWIATPGHTPGHVSLWRERDSVLIAGDAIVTIKVDSVRGLVLGTPVVSAPPAAVTPDWYAARRSFNTLAALRPKVIATGHGEPMHDAAALTGIKRLADDFRIPQHGRYITEPAEFDAQGVCYLPPKPKDRFPVMVGIAAAVVVAGIGIWAARRKADA